MNTFFVEQISVSGKLVSLNEYSVARHEALQEVINEQSKWLKSQPQDRTVDDLTIKEKAKWWKKKADILWKEKFDADFFESKDFEMHLLEKTQTFFLTKRNVI